MIFLSFHRVEWKIEMEKKRRKIDIEIEYRVESEYLHDKFQMFRHIWVCMEKVSHVASLIA